MNTLKTTGDPIPLSTFPDLTPLSPLVTLASHRNLLRGHKASLGISLYEYSVLAEAIAAAVDAEPFKKPIGYNISDLACFVWTAAFKAKALTGYDIDRLTNLGLSDRLITNCLIAAMTRSLNEL